jgi:hypothetical protein
MSSRTVYGILSVISMSSILGRGGKRVDSTGIFEDKGGQGGKADVSVRLFIWFFNPVKNFQYCTALAYEINNRSMLTTRQKRSVKRWLAAISNFYFLPRISLCSSRVRNCWANLRTARSLGRLGEWQLWKLSQPGGVRVRGAEGAFRRRKASGGPQLAERKYEVSIFIA